MMQSPKNNPKEWRETQWFLASKEVQDTKVIKQGVCVCLLGQRRNFACRLPEKGCNHHGKLSKGILFLQDNAAPRMAAITHQKLSDLHSELLKHPVYSPELAPLDYYLFPNLKKHLKGRNFLSIKDATLAAYEWFATQPKEFFLDELKLEQ
jgi:hypothetical protein